MAGISREHLNRIEAGKVKLTDDMQDKLMEAVEKFNPDAPMFLLFDYVRIRFPTLDIQHVIRDILKLNVDYMLHEDYGHYKYTEHYYLQVIMKLCSVILSRNTTRRTKDQLPKVTPHVMRHTFCTRLANAGMNPKALQYVMGHSNITITLNLYAHASLKTVKSEIQRFVA
ncbi:phage replication initiation protein [Enterococcus sp. DIV0421]